MGVAKKQDVESWVALGSREGAGPRDGVRTKDQIQLKEADVVQPEQATSSGAKTSDLKLGFLTEQVLSMVSALWEKNAVFQQACLESSPLEA